MIAILLSKKNAPRIATSLTIKYPLTEEEVVEKVDLQNLVHPDEPVYFIPNYLPRNKSVPDGGWATFPEQAFLETFTADMNKIATQFVEIAYK